jgi:DNA-binding HxlR family transcriptional regulator
LAHDRVTLDIGAFREAALHCPLPAAVELIGEKWAFLILLGGGILERTQDQSDKRKVIYALTEKGLALLPVVLALRQWSEDWGHGPAPVVLADRLQGRPVRRICVQAEDGRELELGDLVWLPREDASEVEESAGQAAPAARRG